MNTHQNSPVISAIYKGFSKLQNAFLKSAYLAPYTCRVNFSVKNTKFFARNTAE